MVRGGDAAVPWPTHAPLPLQKWHWGPGGHKAACTAEASDAASAPAHLAWPHGLPELELLLEEEVLEDDQTEEVGWRWPCAPATGRGEARMDAPAP